MPEHRTQLLIIGSGSAGLTAAIYAARAGLAPTLVAGMQPGGQLTITTDVENYPGFADVVQGPWLMEQMQAQAEKVGTDFRQDLVAAVDFTVRPFQLTGDSGVNYKAATVIIATGAQARWLGLQSETTFNGRGVSACATCDGFFYRGKNVAVIGGGNTAVEEALYLANICKHVTLVHRRDSLRAEKILQERLLRHPNITVAWNRAVDEILGAVGPMGCVTGLRLRATDGDIIDELEVEGVFVAIGHDPATTVFKGAVAMDDEGYLITAAGGTTTNVPGVFAAGDCVDKVYRQAVTAAGMGCMAALDAEKFLAAIADGTLADAAE